MEKRHDLAVQAELTRTAGYGERLAALEMVESRACGLRITVAAHKGYDTADLVMELRDMRRDADFAQNTSDCRSIIDAGTTCPEGFQASQRARKRIEEIFAWVKTIAGLGKT